MNGATAMMRAGTMAVLVTQDGAHTAKDWATATANQLVSIAPEMAPERRIHANALRVHIRDVLTAYFRAVRPGMTSRSFEATVRGAIHMVGTAARGTLWEQSFAQPEIAAMMADVVTRNFNTAALNALASE